MITTVRHEWINRWVPAGLLLLCGAWALALLPLRVVSAGLGIVSAGVVLLRWPWLIWVGVAMVLPVSSAINVGPVSATEGALAVAVMLWLMEGVRRRSLRLELSLPVAATGLYIAALILALFGAQNLEEALAEVVKWLEVVVVLLLLRPMMPPSRAPWLVGALLIGGSSQAILGLYQFSFQIGPEWFIILGGYMRASGTFHQPNPYAGYLGLCLPVAASLALWSWHRFWSLTTGNPKSKIQNLKLVGGALCYTGTAGLIGAGLVASWSRGGWLGALAAVTTILMVRSRHGLITGLVGMLLLVLLLLLGSAVPAWMPAPVTARLQDIPAYFGLTDLLSQPVTDDNFAVIERLAHWAAALRMWEQAPWLGIGLGNYATVYPSVRLPLWEDPLGHAHNIYLNTLAESGLIGLSGYLLFWIAIVGWLWRQHRLAAQAQARWTAALAVGILGVVAHSIVHNLFDNLFVQGIYLQMAFWLAALSVAAPVQTLQSKASPYPPSIARPRTE